MMNRTFVFFLFALCTFGAMAQDDVKAPADARPSEQVIAEPETLAQFPGGQQALMLYLSNNVKYPKAAQQYEAEGRVLMQFFVEKNGKISDISAHECTITGYRGKDQMTQIEQKQREEQFALLFAKEGARVIRRMPRWTPATLKGNPVRVRYVLPIRFASF